MKRNFRVSVLGFFAFLIAVTSVPLTQVADVGAINHVGRLYFSGASRNVDTRNCAVMPGGIYNVGGGSSDQLKANFINIIYGAAMTNDGSGCTSFNGGGSPRSFRQLGARYIIQTMRGQGVGASYNTDQNVINDWVDRINSPSITVARQTYSYGLSTATYWDCRAIPSSCFDVGQYYSNETSESLVFYNNGVPVYALEISCGNPAGDLPGLPVPPPPINFNLTPTISVTPSTSETGTNTTASPVVNNTGSTDSSNVQWQATRFTLNPGVGIPGGGANNTVPVSHYGNGASVIDQGTRTFPRNYAALNPLTQGVPDLPVGSRVCFTLSVQPVTHNDNRWSHSAPACVTIAKKPKVQVTGGDLFVGRSPIGSANVSSQVTTSVTRKTSGEQYGSWSEYAIASTGRVTNMGSAAGYAGGVSVTDFCQVSLLSFVNATSNICTSSTIIGNFAHTSSLPNISARFPAVSATTLPASNTNLDGLQGAYTTNASTYTISASSLSAGRWVVINAPDTTVIISGNINYSAGTINSVNQIPQAVIIARNIIIADNVSIIDSWLVANGTGTDGRINTCGAGGVAETTALNSNNCGTKLTVNGPVMANHLLMRRTSGAGTGAEAGTPGEVFNLRPDAYLWATSQSSVSGRISTIDTKELPPRF